MMNSIYFILQEKKYLQSYNAKVFCLLWSWGCFHKDLGLARRGCLANRDQREIAGPCLGMLVGTGEYGNCMISPFCPVFCPIK